MAFPPSGPGPRGPSPPAWKYLTSDTRRVCGPAPAVTFGTLSRFSVVASRLGHIANGLGNAAFGPPELALRPHTGSAFFRHEDAREPEAQTRIQGTGRGDFDCKGSVVLEPARLSVFPEFVPQVLARLIFSYLCPGDLVLPDAKPDWRAIRALAGLNFSVPAGLKAALYLDWVGLPPGSVDLILRQAQQQLAGVFGLQDAARLTQARLSGHERIRMNACWKDRAEAVHEAEIVLRNFFHKVPHSLLFNGILAFGASSVAILTFPKEEGEFTFTALACATTLSAVNVCVAPMISVVCDARHHFRFPVLVTALLTVGEFLARSAATLALIAENAGDGSRADANAWTTLFNAMAFFGTVSHLVRLSKLVEHRRALVDAQAARRACEMELAAAQAGSSSLSETVHEGLRYAVRMTPDDSFNVVVRELATGLVFPLRVVLDIPTVPPPAAATLEEIEDLDQA
jgi:hypothetical protein